MAGLLGDLYGYIDSKKRGLLDAFNNPGDALQQFVGNLGDSVNQSNDMMQRTGLAPTVYGKTNATQQQQALARALMAEQGAQMGMAGVVGYHGTMSPNFEKFNLDNFGKTDQGWLGKGVYAAKSPTDASAYAMVDGKPGGAVLKVDMDLKNPLNIDWEAANRAEMLSKRRELGPEGFTAWLQKQGHDGVIFQGPKNALNSAGERDIQYMAIDPEMVKQIGY